MDLTDIYRIFYPKTEEYTFYWAAHGSFSKRDHILGYKTNLNKFRRIETIPCVLSTTIQWSLRSTLNKSPVITPTHED